MGTLMGQIGAWPTLTDLPIQDMEILAMRLDNLR